MRLSKTSPVELAREVFVTEVEEVSMRIGCSLLTGQDMEAAVQAGFDYVELMGKYLVSLQERDFAMLLRQQDRLSLPVLGLNGYCPKQIQMIGVEFTTGRAREYAKACAVRAHRLGVKYVGIGSPMSRNLSGEITYGEAVRQLEQFLSVTAEVFSKYDITVCLEALARCYCNFVNDLQEAADIVKELRLSNLALVVDFYNMEHMGEADTDLKRFAGHIAHAHISDDDGSPSARSYLKREKRGVHQQRIRNLLAAGYGGAVSLEIDCRIDVERAGQSADMLRNAVAVM